MKLGKQPFSSQSFPAEEKQESILDCSWLATTGAWLRSSYHSQMRRSVILIVQYKVPAIRWFQVQKEGGKEAPHRWPHAGRLKTWQGKNQRGCAEGFRVATWRGEKKTEQQELWQLKATIILAEWQQSALIRSTGDKLDSEPTKFVLSLWRR